MYPGDSLSTRPSDAWFVYYPGRHSYTWLSLVSLLEDLDFDGIKSCYPSYDVRHST